jgi:dolichol-phosphate mannosyltransferase
MKSVVFVPAFNEKENIPAIVETILGLKEDIKILFVDDASEDGTGNLLDELTMKYPDIKVMYLKKEWLCQCLHSRI